MLTKAITPNMHAGKLIQSLLPMIAADHPHVAAIRWSQTQWSTLRVV